MTEPENKILLQLILYRQEVAFRRLKEDAAFQVVCERQIKSGADVEELLCKLDNDERATVRRHYEGETEKVGFELNAVYKQGLRDSVKILALLGVFEAGMKL